MQGKQVLPSSSSPELWLLESAMLVGGCSSPALLCVKGSHWPTPLDWLGCKLTSACSHTHGVTICLFSPEGRVSPEESNQCSWRSHYWSNKDMIPHCKCCQLQWLAWAWFVRWRDSVCPSFQITKVPPLDCTVPLKLKTSKKEVRTLKLLPPSLSACMHFSVLELGNLSVLICVWRLLICPRHLSCPAVLPASLWRGVERCCEVSMAVLKGTTDLVLRAELSPVRDILPVLLNTNSPLPPLCVKTHLMTWPFSPPHQIQHIQKLCLTLHALRENPIPQRSNWDYFHLKKLLKRSS